MEIFKILYTAFGGLGLFFFGMKSMTDGLQALGSTLIKRIISSLTSNRLLAVVVGLVVTTIVQSSSITTVMVLGFVNSGLMTLTQAIGVIFGANIGTTITGWIISIKVGKYGLLLIALSIYPALYAKSTKVRHIGRSVFGIGLIFFGLQLMSGAFKPLRTYPGFIDYLHAFSGTGYSSILLSVLMGCILTMVIQSSSAMLGITIALAVSGTIQFNTAAALVLGENIGTTITALLASVGANINAKRAARAHAGFNLFGVVIMIIIFPYYLDLIEWLIPGPANFVDAAGDRPYIAYHIALGHTIFNVTATLIFLPFLTQFSNLIMRLTPDKTEKEVDHLTTLGDFSTLLPAAAIIRSQAEIRKMKSVVDGMFKDTQAYLASNETLTDVFDEIRRHEAITDAMQKEITVYLCQVMQKSMSLEQSNEIQAYIRVADELESIADYLDRLAFYGQRLKEEKAIEGTLKEELHSLIDEVSEYYQAVCVSLDEEGVVNSKQIHKTSDEIKKHIDSIREQHVSRVAKQEYPPLSALTYSDMVVAIRKIRSHTLNIAEAMNYG